MEIKIAACDDSAEDRQYLTEAVRRWSRKSERPVHFDAFTCAETFLFHYAEEKDYHILLLDVEMDGMDGVSLAKALREKNDFIQIVFITGYSDYIAEGYDVAALHYLLKPIDEEKLFLVLDRAVKKLRENERVLRLLIGGEMILMPLRQIRYADVLGNYVTIHGKEDWTLKKPLGELSKELDEIFFRLGRSVIVNLSYVTRVSRSDVHLSDGTILPLPRGSYEKINRAIIDRGGTYGTII